MSAQKKYSKAILSKQINGDLPVSKKQLRVVRSHRDDLVSDPVEPTVLLRLDVLLSEQFPLYSRTQLKNAIKAGMVRVDGKITTRASQTFPRGVLLSLDEQAFRAILARPLPAKVAPKLTKNHPSDHDGDTPASQNLAPKCLYEDDKVLVFSKPSGLLSMKKGTFSPEPSMQDYGLIVHRLDRATSGVMILAKDLPTKAFLQKQFATRKVQKTYFAIVLGAPKPPEALIDLPIQRNPKRPTTFMVGKDGREAKTAYFTLFETSYKGQKLSLVRLLPQTGRTHQLRVHLKYLNLPILGDFVYHPTGPKVERLFLHAYKLTINLPGQKQMSFVSPLPQAFLQFFPQADAKTLNQVTSYVL